MFTAPEQATADQGRICAQTDLYALGVILYWMLTGQPPFFAESNAVLLAMHVCDKPRPLRNLTPAVPEAIAALVEQCLAKEPRERPASARALAAAFGAALDELSGVEAAGYDDGPSGVMVFVPPTPIVEVATAATASAKPPASGPGFKVSFSPLAAVGSIPSAELADEVETEVEVPPRPPSSAAAPPPRALPPRREEPVDQDLVPTIPPPGADASEPAPTKPPGAADGARAPELSLGDDEDDVDTRVDVEGGEPRAEVVVRVPARVTVAERPQPLLAAQRAPQAAGKPARVATSWLPWVLVAISVAVAVAIALLK
jgi:serine/threonine-protein kinase